MHRLLGFTAIGGITLGATLWLLAMVPSCAESWNVNACDAFKVSIGDGAFTNVLVLRLIVGPLWLGFLPLLNWADINWSTVESALIKETHRHQVSMKENSSVGRMFSSKRIQKRDSLEKASDLYADQSDSSFDRILEIIAYWRAHWSVAPAVLWFSSAIGLIGASISFCLLYTSPSPRDKRQSRMPSSA